MKRAICFLLAVFYIAVLFPFNALSFEANPFEIYDYYRNDRISLSVSSNGNQSANAMYTPSDNGTKYIVTFKSEISLQDIYECVQEYDFRLLADSSERVFSVSIKDLSAFRNKYSKIVKDINEDTKLSLSAYANDPLAQDQWELDFLDMYTAWDKPLDSAIITVAVLDSGIYREHVDFNGVTILDGYDAVTHNVGVYSDENGHGTQVSSIIAAKRNNNLGMSGIADFVQLMPIRVSDTNGYVHSSDFIEAVYYAADAGVDILNMSFGGYIYSAQEEAAMKYASSCGCIMVSSAGNEATSDDYAGMKSYPASYGDVISVGACDSDGVVCDFSQHNEAVDMLAPGQSITVANYKGGYETISGTSYSAAYVSGIIALALAGIDSPYAFSSDQFTSYIAHIRGSAWNSQYGYGAINADTVLTSINTPMVSGVINGGVYIGNVSVNFNRGKATLDGKAFLSGESVIVSGNHSLIITDNETEYVYEFITDNIPLKYDYKQYSDSAVFTFGRGTATVDGIPYISGTAIKDKGKHIFELTGPYGNTESFEFVCEFEAPQIFGVENGKTYTHAVHISVPIGGVVTLDGVEIDNSTVVSTNGRHSLVSATADGKHKRSVSFTVNIEGSKLYKAFIANAQIAADEKYGYMLMYNDFLSGARVIMLNDPNNTKSFIRTEEGIIGHRFTDTHIILLHANGVSVLNRQAVGEGNSFTADYVPFRGNSSSAFFIDNNVYYYSSKGSTNELYRMNAFTGASNLVGVLNGGVSIADSDGKHIVAADGSLIHISDHNGKLIRTVETEKAITALICRDSYICTESYVYSAKTGDKLFSLFSGERPLEVINGMLVTNLSVYNLSSGIRKAKFSSSIYDIEITERAVYKSLPQMKYEIITSDSSVALNSIESTLGACLETDLFLGEINTSSVYTNFSAVLPNANVTYASIDKASSTVFAVSSSDNSVRYINGKDMSLVKTVKTKFTPSSVCYDGKSCYVSFAKDNYIAVISSNGQITYYKTRQSYSMLNYANGMLYALTPDGNLYALKASNPTGTERIIILSQNIVSFDIDGEYAYAYLKPASVSMVYKIRLSNGSTEKFANVKSANGRIFAENGNVYVGKAVLRASDLSTQYRLSEDIEYAYGKYLITKAGLYSSTEGSLISKCTVPTDLPMFDSQYNYYCFGDRVFTKLENVRSDLQSMPTLEGVADGGIYEENVTVSYSFGAVYIDGKYIPSGSVVNGGGRHTLSVVLPFGVRKSISFGINAYISGISLRVDKNTVKVNETASLSVLPIPNNYGNIVVVYTADTDNVIVDDEGTIIGLHEGECTVTATTLDGKYSDSVKITVVKTELKFNSSYFEAVDESHIVKVSAGTALSALYDALSETHGSSGVFSVEGIRIEGGVLATDMLVKLFDMQNSVIDEWSVSVLGDVDCDGYVTANDYRLLQTLHASSESLSKAVFAAADTDGNGFINAFDTLNIKEHLLGANIMGGVVAYPEREAKAKLTITAPPTINHGGRFTVGLLLTDAENASAISGRLIYDTAMLAFESCEAISDGWNGHYDMKSGEISFFSYGEAKSASRVLLLLSFTVLPNIEQGANIKFKATDITVYNGSAASVKTVDRIIEVREKPVTYIVVHNLTDFNFNREQSEYSIHLPANTQKVHISVAPEDRGELVGSLSFGNALKTDFSVVLSTGETAVEQYNFHCTRDESTVSELLPTPPQKSSDCVLAELTVNGGTVSPSFLPEIYDYFVVAKSPSEVVVSAKARDEKAAVTVTDISAEGIITVICTAEDGTSAKYTLTVNSNNPAGNEFIPKEESRLGIYITLTVIIIIICSAVLLYFYYKKKLVK